MWEFFLRLLRKGLFVVGNNYDADVSLGKVLVMIFKLTELDHANESPMASEENQGRRRALFEIMIRKRRPVGKRRRERRHLAADLRRPGVRRRPARIHDEPFGRTNEQQQDKASDPNDAPALPHGREREEDAKGCQ